jgi:hypothetical protein
MAELAVPRKEEVSRRLAGFYADIGWTICRPTDSEFFTRVSPTIEEATPPTISYWQTENPGKIGKFTVNESSHPSAYARGLRLPDLQELVEVWLVVPSDESVHTVFERGGKLLQSHAHIAPREHMGRQEFRFSDPFNYSLRVTADPLWLGKA